MYTLKDKEIICENICDNNFEYLLEKNSYFSQTDYKVLLSQTNGIFVKCMKMIKNGKIDLYYNTEEYRPMTSLFSTITPDILVSIVINLFASVIEVRNNGFLACQCIDLSWDKIFVEPSTLKVKLVYLPLNVKAFETYAEFESELRTGVVKLINKVLTTSTDRLDKFVPDLFNGSLSLEDVYNRSRNVGSNTVINKDTVAPSNMPQNANVGIKLVAMNAPSYFEIVIDSNNVLIGKKAELVDKAITFNAMISRKHCRITNMKGVFYIIDEGSANGTYVNNSRVMQGQQMQINKGDIIRLANSDFQVV